VAKEQENTILSQCANVASTTSITSKMGSWSGWLPEREYSLISEQQHKERHKTGRTGAGIRIRIGQKPKLKSSHQIRELMASRVFCSVK